MNIILHSGEEIPAFTIPKSPTAVLDYGMIWDDWLRTGETIVSASWVATVFTVDSWLSGVQREICGVVYNNIEVVWLSSGTIGSRGLVTNTITTSLSRTQVRSFYLWCKQT